MALVLGMDTSSFCVRHDHGEPIKETISHSLQRGRGALFGLLRCKKAVIEYVSVQFGVNGFVIAALSVLVVEVQGIVVL